MDSHQGAGFAFDMTMDFSNVFATKPNEGETSNSFFFGDEGIDTTTTLVDPIMFPQQDTYNVPNSLVSEVVYSMHLPGWTNNFTVLG
jgi:hypothetical protein